MSDDPREREAFYASAGAFADGLLVRTARGTLVLPADDPVIGLQTFRDRGFANQTLATLLDVLETIGHPRQSFAGRDVVEVGANVGTQTLSFVRDLDVRRVIALEPSPSVRRYLQAMIAINELQDRIEVVPIAASDREASVRMELNPGNVGDHRIAPATEPGADHMGEASWSHVSVRARPLDALVAEGIIDLDACALLWVDAQGHEGHVLAGARTALDAGVPVIAEFWPYGLRRAGGFERLCDLVAETATRVVDLRTEQDCVPVEVDPASLADHAAVYDPPAIPPSTGFTDLLLLPRRRAVAPRRRGRDRVRALRRGSPGRGHG